MTEEQITFSSEARTKSVLVQKGSTGVQDNKKRAKLKFREASVWLLFEFGHFFSHFHTYNFPSVMAPLRNVVGLDQAFSLCGHFVLCWFVFMWFEAAVMLKHSHYFCEHQRKKLRAASCVNCLVCSEQRTRPQILAGHQTPPGPGPDPSVPCL